MIQKINRRQYYQVLDHADRDHPGPLVNFVGRAVERSLMLYLEACKPVLVVPPQEEQWISLREAALDTPYSQEYLSLLARTGRIEAVKRGRVWFTTRQALEDYSRSVG